jgi:hypothetical protein
MKFICQSQQSAAEIMKALQTVDGDNDLTPFSPHLASFHFWLNPRLKLEVRGRSPATLADIKCNPTARQYTTQKKAVHVCCQARQNYWKECVCFKYLSLTAEFRKLFEKPGIWPWKQHWKKFTLMNLLLKLGGGLGSTPKPTV